MEFRDRDSSCYLVPLLIKYGQKQGISDTAILKGVEEYRELLLNPLEWADTRVIIKIFDNFIEASGGDEESLVQAGIDITLNQVSQFQLFFFKIAPLRLIFNHLTKHAESNITTSMKMYARHIGKKKVEYIVNPIDKRTKYSRSVCAYDRGCATATLILKGYKNVQYREICCAARGESDQCIYHFSWDPDPPFVGKIRNFFMFRFTFQKAIISHMEESQRKLQEQYREILGMKDFYSHIMHNMDESVIWLDAAGKITFANDAFISLVKIRSEEVSNHKLHAFFSIEGSAAEYLEMITACRCSPGVPITRELKIDLHNDELRTGQVNCIWVPGQNRAPGYLITIRDITETKKIEEQLFMAEDRYRALYENSPAIIVGLDKYGKFLFANPAMIEQSGYSEKELKSMHFSKLLAPNAEFDISHLLSDRLNDQTRLQEVHFKTKSGEWKCIAFNNYPIYDNYKKIAGLAGIGIDITETKRLNEQIIKAQRMELLGQLAGGLAHDFNNLLTSISGYSAFIEKIAPEGKIRGYTEIIQNSSKRAAELVKNLLDFSRGNVAKTDKFNINNLINEVREIIYGIVPKSIDVKIDIPDSPQIVLGDVDKIHQCIMNLCVNARDAITKSSGTITIRVKEAENKEGYLWVQVEDTGTGISPDIIEKIFDPFFSTKKKKEGTGLGLSVVYGIIKAHKGDIFIDSRPGEGSTFTLELPVFQGNNNAGKKHVVILDDDAMLRNYCMEILRGSGFDAIDFASVKEAVQWLHLHPDNASLVISDIVLPDMDVKEFLSTLHTIKQDFKCIWMSGYRNPELQNIIKYQPFLQKPFSPNALLDIIKSANCS